MREIATFSFMRSPMHRCDGILDCVSRNAPVQRVTLGGAKSAEPRRVLHIEYADSLDLGPGMRLAIV
jgi:hypothetical protein